MELFVVNRFDENIEKVDANNPSNVEQEQEKLDKVLKRIERNKRLRNKQKDKEEKVKKAIENTVKVRKLKREKKAKIVHVPEDDNKEFIDETILSTNETISEAVEISNDQSAKIKIAAKRKRKLGAENVEGFTILGVDNFVKKNKVKRVLPRWLTNPTIISANLQNLDNKVSDLKVLDKSIQNLLQAQGILHFFPVQIEVIPWLLENNRYSDIIFPRDVCISAPTGSGKTLAFVLPVIQIIKKYKVKKIRALAILPTQDLAKQVFKCFKTYSEGTNIDTCIITGQNSFEVEQKQILYKNDAFGFLPKVDILVCTAGRLVDHLKLTKGFDLTSLEFLIIDEADRVLENMQNDWLYHLEKHILPDSVKVLNQFSLQKRRPPQKLLFSATLSQDPEKLQQLSLFQPKLFTSIMESNNEGDSLIPTETHQDKFIGKYTTPKELSEKYIETSMDLKPLVLYKFIKQEKLKRVLIFTHSVDSSHRLTILLKAMFKKKYTVEEISSHLQPKLRSELIDKFGNGKIDILISTDSLARGIDLPNVQCVISYSAPKYLKSYIHRAGRTARAGENGIAVTFLHSSQTPKFKTMLKHADKDNVEEIKISEEDLEPLGEQYKESLVTLRETVKNEDKISLKKMKYAKKSKLKKKVNQKIQSIQ